MYDTIQYKEYVRFKSQIKYQEFFGQDFVFVLVIVSTCMSKVFEIQDTCYKWLCHFKLTRALFTFENK